MRPSLPVSGGGPRHVYPKHVWSWSGGWWANPARWKGNTFFAAAAMCVASAAIWSYGSSLEVRYDQDGGAAAAAAAHKHAAHGHGHGHGH